jgi:hypothetical protein
MDLSQDRLILELEHCPTDPIANTILQPPQALSIWYLSGPLSKEGSSINENDLHWVS